LGSDQAITSGPAVAKLLSIVIERTHIGRKKASRFQIGACLLLALFAWSPFSSIAPVVGHPHFQDLRLKQGDDPLTRDIEAPGNDTFKIQIPPNHYFRVVVEQLGIALIVTLKDPTNAVVVQTESYSGARGPLYVSEIATTGGDYTLQVRSSEGWVNPGRYQITLESVRPPEPKDRERVAAEKTLAEGQVLLEAEPPAGTKPADILRRAITKFTEAADQFKRLNDIHGEVMSLHLIGVTYHRRLSESTEAQKVFSQAVELAKQLPPNDWRLAATISNDLGEVYRNLYDQQQARSMFRDALRIFEAHDDQRGRATVSNNLGLSYSATGEGREALELFRTALQIRQLEHDKALEINTIGNLASAYYALGEFHEALLSAQQALAGWRELKRTDKIANSLNTIGLMYEKLGLWQQAIDNYQQALETAGASVPKRGLGASLLNIGDLYSKLNDSSRALENYEKSLTLYREITSPGDEANVLSHIGTVHTAQNNLTEALGFLNRALQIAETNPTLDLRRTHAYTLIGVGEVYRLQGKFADALSCFERARKIAESVGDRQQESDSEQKLGETYVALGQLPKAQESYGKALDLRRKLEDKPGEATTLYHIASLKRDLNQLTDAEEASATALKLFEGIRGSIISQQLRTSYFETTQRCFELYIDIKLQRFRSDSDQKHLAEALTANERAHARSLVDALAKTSPEIVQGVNPILLQKKRDLMEKLSSKAETRQALLNEKELRQQAYAAGQKKYDLEALTRTEQRLASLAVDIQAVIAQADDIETQIQRDSPRYAALTEPQSLNLDQIQRELLDDDTLLLEYALGDRRSYAFVVTSTSIKAIELPKREEIESLARRLGTSLTARKLYVNGETPSQRKRRLDKASVEYTEAASRFSQMVIGPVASLLSKQRVLLVTDGDLQLMPFTIFLLEDYELISLPSASVLAAQRRELQGRKTAPNAVAVLANPVFDSSDFRVRTARKTRGAEKSSSLVNAAVVVSKNVKPLPGSVLSLRSTPEWLPSSADEAKAIAAVAPAGQTMLALGFKASRATAVSPALSQYRIVHFATHGITDPEHPELSGIILSLVDENGVEQDGYLRLYEIYNLNLPAELVVLSACESGVGKQFKGEGLIALTRGFIYAGAARVVASLWKVDNTATAALMTELYKEMFTNGKKPAAALRAAQLTISKQARWRDPYFWAGFIIQGEWR
jgi:CHAT domain-containing protein